MKSPARVFVVCLFLSLCISLSYAENRGIITGRVLDSITGAAITGAEISIETTSISTQSDRSGGFLILDLPAGSHNVVITSLGYNAGTFAVDVADGQTVDLKASLIPVY